jgi:hypothetical protein
MNYKKTSESQRARRFWRGHSGSDNANRRKRNEPRWRTAKERRRRTLPDMSCSWTRVPRPGTVRCEVLFSGGILGDDAGPTGW